MTRNLTAKGDCLIIKADNVTLDLGGFVLSGDRTGTGITDKKVDRQRIVVRNGTIRSFGSGISLSFTQDAVVEGVSAHNNNGIGIKAGDSNHTGSIVIGNTASDNSGGIWVGPDSVVSNNIVRFDKGGLAIEVGKGSIVSNNIASEGFDGVGIKVGLGSTVSGDTITVIGDFATGMIVDSGSTVSGNTVSFNEGDGIVVSCPSVVIGNTAFGNKSLSGLPESSNLILEGDGCIDVNNVAP